MAGQYRSVLIGACQSSPFVARFDILLSRVSVKLKETLYVRETPHLPLMLCCSLLLPKNTASLGVIYGRKVTLQCGADKLVISSLTAKSVFLLVSMKSILLLLVSQTY